jgi:hypothetical protein
MQKQILLNLSGPSDITEHAKQTNKNLTPDWGGQFN